MPTNRTSRFAIVALTAVAPFALAAGAFAADNTMGSTPSTKPAITDSTIAGGKVVQDKDKDAKKSTDAKSGAADVKGADVKGATGSKLGTADKHSALDEKATSSTHAATPADKSKATAKSGASGSSSNHTTGTGLSPALNDSAKANSSAKPGTVTHGGSDVTPNPALNPAGKL